MNETSGKSAKVGDESEKLGSVNDVIFEAALKKIRQMTDLTEVV